MQQVDFETIRNNFPKRVALWARPYTAAGYSPEKIARSYLSVHYDHDAFMVEEVCDNGYTQKRYPVAPESLDAAVIDEVKRVREFQMGNMVTVWSKHPERKGVLPPIEIGAGF